MKLIITTVFLAITFYSCKKSSNNNTTNNPVSGTWKISYYWDQKEETSNFTAYTFMFNSGDVLMAHTSTTSITGTWSESSSRFTINFGSTPILSDLNGDWLKTEKTNTSIKLKEDNPAQDDQLYFIKN